MILKLPATEVQIASLVLPDIICHKMDLVLG